MREVPFRVEGGAGALTGVLGVHYFFYKIGNDAMAIPLFPQINIECDKEPNPSAV